MWLEQGRLLKNRSNSAGDRETVNNNRNRAGGTRGLLTTVLSNSIRGGHEGC